MINNIELIRPLLNFPNDKSFYFVQILQRKKENPELGKNARNVDNFFIYSSEDFEKYLPKITECCDKFNARAYIRLNIRDAEVVAIRTAQKVFDLIIQKQFKQAKNAYLTVCGESQSSPDKSWIIDLDGEQAQPEFYTKVLNTICSLRENPIIALMPTVNGLHIISRPFHGDKFREVHPNIDIHKDNPTILYAP